MDKEKFLGRYERIQHELEELQSAAPEEGAWRDGINEAVVALGRTYTEQTEPQAESV